MDIYNATVYCASAQMNLSSLSDDSATKQHIKEEAEQWALHYSHFTDDEAQELVIYCARKNVKEAGWNEYDVDGVAWFIGVYSIVAVESGLANDFNIIFIASFIRYFNK
jgi:hypothetical protein